MDDTKSTALLNQRKGMAKDQNNQILLNPTSATDLDASYGESNRFKLWSVVQIICISSLLYGYTIGELNGPLTGGRKGSLDADFEMNETNAQLSTISMIVGAMIGAAVSENMADKIGRRRIIVLNNIPYLVGHLVMAFSPKNAIWVLILGRFIAGFASGFTTTVTPTLVAEISPDEIRGALTTLHQLNTTIGILISALVGYVCQDIEHGWRYTLGVGIIPAGLHLVLGAASIPESPRWLVRQRKVQEAASVLRSHRAPYENIQEELKTMEEEMENKDDSVNNASWEELFRFQKGIVIGLGLMAAQQLTGINTVMFYSSSIFQFAGVESAILGTVAVTGTNVLMTVVAVWLIDRLGRRSLLLIGITIMMISLSVLGIVLMTDMNQKTQGAICIILVVMFVIGFAIGLGVAPWPLLAEIYPSHIRSKGMSLNLGVNWTANLILNAFALTLITKFGGGDSQEQKKQGVAILFLCFAVLSFLSLIFTFLIVPETKGRKMEDIAAELLDSSDSALESPGHWKK